MTDWPIGAARQRRAPQTRPLQIGVLQLRRTHVRPLQAGPGQIGAPQIGIPEVGGEQVALIEVGETQAPPSKDGSFERRARVVAKLTLPQINKHVIVPDAPEQRAMTDIEITATPVNLLAEDIERREGGIFQGKFAQGSNGFLVGPRHIDIQKIYGHDDRCKYDAPQSPGDRPVKGAGIGLPAAPAIKVTHQCKQIDDEQETLHRGDEVVLVAQRADLDEREDEHRKRRHEQPDGDPIDAAVQDRAGGTAIASTNSTFASNCRARSRSASTGTIVRKSRRNWRTFAANMS